MIDLGRLQRTLGVDDLRWLVDRIRSRLAEGRPLTGSVTLAGATEAQRAAAARLLGRQAGRGASLSVWLPGLEETLRRGGLAPDLAAAVSALSGPVANRAAARAAEAAAWEAAFAPVARAAGRRPALAVWEERVRATGLLHRLVPGDPGAARQLAEQAAVVLERLPAAGVPLSVLASTVAGDGHALDEDRPLSTLVLHGATVLAGIPAGEGSEWRRTVWASVGVLYGELTSPVLTLNLPGDAATVTGRALAVWRDAGQPVHLTVRQLLRDPPELRLRGRSVFVCENPVVVAEASNSIGTQSAPLVCVSGHPAGAATLLLGRLVEAGAVLRYHGDFDWPGVTIANGVVARFGARSWRFDAAAYRSSVAAGRGGAPLRGAPVVAGWDAALTSTMAKGGVRVEEETVLDDLLGDLLEADGAS
jgi:uncharacterized protein (TIGR02679 family)